MQTFKTTTLRNPERYCVERGLSGAVQPCARRPLVALVWAVSICAPAAVAFAPDAAFAQYARPASNSSYDGSSAQAAQSDSYQPVFRSQEVVQALPPAEVDDLNTALQRVSRNPRDANALIDAGNAALALGDMDGAIGFFGRADDISPGNPRIKMGLARAFVRTERPIEALRLIYEAEGSGASTLEVAEERALAYDLVGDNANAQNYYRRALAQRPDDETLRRLALSLAISGDEQGMEQTLSPLLEKQDRAAFRTRALGLAALGKNAEAEELARAVMPAQLAQRVMPYLNYFPRLTAAQKAAAGNLGIFPAASRIGRDDPRITAYIASKGTGTTDPVLAAVPQVIRPERRPNTTAAAVAAGRNSRAVTPAPVKKPAPAIAANTASAESRLVPRGRPLGQGTADRVSTAVSATKNETKPISNSERARARAEAEKAKRLAAAERRARREARLLGSQSARIGRRGSPVVRTVRTSQVLPKPVDTASQSAVTPQVQTAAVSAPQPAVETAIESVGLNIRETGTPKSAPEALGSNTAAAPASVEMSPAVSSVMSARGLPQAISPVTGVAKSEPSTDVASVTAIGNDSAPLTGAGEKTAVAVSDAALAKPGFSAALSVDANAAGPNAVSEVAGTTATAAIAPSAAVSSTANSASESVNVPMGLAETQSALAKQGAHVAQSSQVAAQAPSVQLARGPGSFDLSKLGQGPASTGTSSSASTGDAASLAAKPSAEQSVDTGVVAADSIAKNFADFAALPETPVGPIKGAVDITTLAPAEGDSASANAHPSRIWVQLASGADADALSYDWRRFKGKAGAALEPLGGYVAPWGKLNRLLAGPFASRDAAGAAVKQLGEAGIEALIFTSEDGQEITALK